MGKRSKFCGVIENEVALFIEKIIVRGQSTCSSSGIHRRKSGDGCVNYSEASHQEIYSRMKILEDGHVFIPLSRWHPFGSI